MAICFLGVGSNLGNRKENIKLAVNKLKKLKGTKVIRVSSLIETMPVGGTKGQRKFMNAAVKLSTSLTPLTLLKKIKNIENELGRRKTVRFGPRIIDLDILLCGDKLVNTARLKIPHPRMIERDFVLEPLSEII